MNQLEHAGIIGKSKSGKSFLAMHQAREYKKRGIPVLVCDPFLCPDWKADYMTDDIEKFVKVARQASGCVLYVEECGQVIGSNPPPSVQWLTTGSRHNGHAVRLCAQRGTMFNLNMRSQLDELYLFRVHHSDADEWAKIFGDDRLKEAGSIPRHLFFYKSNLNDEPAKLCKLSI